MSSHVSLSEEQIFQKTIAAFKFYRVQMTAKATKSIDFYKSIPESQKQLIPDFLDNMNKFLDCIESNAQVIDLFAQYSDGNEQGFFSMDFANVKKPPITSVDMDKVRSTLKQFVRDWSQEGALERQLCYQPVIDEIKGLFERTKYKSKENYQVLVPGAGLARLAWEIARLGFTCQGNEWSIYMLLPANYILNKCSEANILKIYPWLSNYCNNPSRDNQLTAVRFPDVDPSDMPTESNFSMAMGDFVEIYIQPDNWDCVATVFFIDTANNILDYLDTIWKILKPGGHWINLGPLLYHHCESFNVDSIEISYEELKKAILLKGFNIITKKYPIEATYTQDRNSMLTFQYKCVFFVAEKPLSASFSSSQKSGSTN